MISFEVPPTDVLTAIGAFLAGVGSLLGGVAAIRLARSKGAKDAREDR